MVKNEEVFLRDLQCIVLYSLWTFISCEQYIQPCLPPTENCLKADWNPTRIQKWAKNYPSGNTSHSAFGALNIRGSLSPPDNLENVLSWESIAAVSDVLQSCWGCWPGAALQDLTTEVSQSWLYPLGNSQVCSRHWFSGGSLKIVCYKLLGKTVLKER